MRRGPFLVACIRLYDGRPMATIVCGIDPGLGLTGFAVLNARTAPAQVLDAGVCRFSSKESLASRLAAIHADISAILDDHRPNLVAVEQLYSHYNHPRTAILMGHARGVILQAAASRGIEVRSYSATRIKRFLTGNGRATKAQVQRAIQMTFSLPAPPDPPDVADALAIALCATADPASRELQLTRRDTPSPLGRGPG